MRLPMGVLHALFERNSLLSKLLSDEAGATAIEYGLIAALIAVAAIAAFQLVGTNLTSVFNTVATDL
jgi:pilus assembly protein Flp/PilA